MEKPCKFWSKRLLIFERESPPPETGLTSLGLGMRLPFLGRKNPQTPRLVLFGPSYELIYWGNPDPPSPSNIPRPKDLLVSHRTSWGILPQSPVFSLRSAHCVVFARTFHTRLHVPSHHLLPEGLFNGLNVVLPSYAVCAGSLMVL